MATNQVIAADGSVQQWDTATGYTARDAAGNVTTQRPLTAKEAAAMAAQDSGAPSSTNADTLRFRAQAALTANATFLALATPTAAQVTAQVQRATKELDALIRLALSQTDDISGT